MLPSEFVAQGWCQHQARVDDRYCLAAAIKAAGHNLLVWQCIIERLVGVKALVLRRYCGANYIIDVGGIATWNDAPGRTQAEVVALARLVEYKLGLWPADDQASEVILPPTDLEVARS